MMSLEYKQDGSQSRLVGMVVSFKFILGCRQLDWWWCQQIPLSVYVQAQVGWGRKWRDEVEQQATTPGGGRKRLDGAGISQTESHGPSVRGKELIVLKVTTRGHVPSAWTVIELMFLMFLCLFNLASIYFILLHDLRVYAPLHCTVVCSQHWCASPPPQGSAYPKEISKIKWTASKQERLSSLCAEGGCFPCFCVGSF